MDGWLAQPLTFYAFVALVLGVAVQRLLEMRYSKRNEAALLARGAREHAPSHFIFMKIVHALWLPAMVAEVLLLGRAFSPAVAGLALLLLVAGQALRYAAIRGLGDRWTVRILTVPGAAPVTGGIYRYVRHPNYVGVVLEIAALPMIHCAWWTAVAFSFANALVLVVRIRAEERALDEDNDYRQHFAMPGSGA